MKRPRPMESASAFIDERIKELGDWRGKTLAKVREIIHEADPEIVEERKWVRTTSPGTFQLQPRRECQARHRHPRRRQGR
jgi:hypothetical protein